MVKPKTKGQTSAIGFELSYPQYREGVLEPENT